MTKPDKTPIALEGFRGFKVQMIRLEMDKALDLIAMVPDNQEFKEQFLKAVKAGRLYKQTRDPELQALIRKVEEML